MNEKILAEKKAYTEEISELLKVSQATIVVEYRGLKVNELEKLRRALATQDAEFRILKNTMVLRALKAKGYVINNPLEGPNGFVFSKKDPVSGPKVLAEFIKKNKMLVIKSGLMDGKEISASDVNKLGTMPNKEGLLSMFIGCLKEPIRKFAATVAEIKK